MGTARTAVLPGERARQGLRCVPAAVGAASLLVACAVAVAISGRRGPSPLARLGLVGLAESAEGRTPALRAPSNESAESDAAASRDPRLDQLLDKLEGLHKSLDSVDNMARLMEQGYHLQGIIFCDLNATVCGNATAPICCASSAACCGEPTAQICCGAGNTCCPNGLCVQKPEHCLVP